MKQNNSLRIILILIFAVVVSWGGTFGEGSYVLASNPQQEGGLDMSASENQITPGTASGYVSLNGVKINLNYAYALAQPNTFDEKKMDIALLLTEQPVPEGELKDVEGLEFVAHSKHNYALFKINDQGKPIHEVIEHPVLDDTRLMMSGFTNAQFDSKVFSKERIEGSFRTKAETDFSGYKYEINVKFNAQIQRAKLPEPLPDAKTGKALPPDGGNPAKAYFDYLKAIEKKDIAAIRKLLQLPAGIKVTDDEMKRNLEFMAEDTPKNLKITKGYINSAGVRAVVYFTGTADGEKVYGEIVTIKKEGSWMVAEQNWSDKPPKNQGR